MIIFVSGHSITGHKSQGMTVRDPRVLVTDLRSAFTDALSYVISSRIESIEQIFFSHSLPRKKFKCSQTVLEEIDRLEDISINNNPTAWFQDDDNYIKISALNVYKLDRHFEDLKSDVSLMKSSLICCVETWLAPPKDEDEMEEQINYYNIEGYSTHLNSVGAGKGIAIFSKPPFSRPQNSNGTNFQITKITSPDLDVICVYRSQEGNKRDLLSKLLDILTPNKATYICGDFNICLFTEPQNVLTDTLKQNNFVQIVEKPTFKSGSLLDHGYVRETNPFTVTTYAPYWSDHDAVLLVVHKEKDGIIQEKQHIPKTTSDIPAKRKQRSEKTDSPSKKIKPNKDFDEMDRKMQQKMKAERNQPPKVDPQKVAKLLQKIRDQKEQERKQPSENIGSPSKRMKMDDEFNKKSKRKLKNPHYASPSKKKQPDEDFDEMDRKMEEKMKAERNQPPKVDPQKLAELLQKIRDQKEQENKKK